MKRKGEEAEKKERNEWSKRIGEEDEEEGKKEKMRAGEG
jgi:hypothetical protein